MVQRNCMIIFRRIYNYYVKNVRVKRLQCSAISICFLMKKYFLKKINPCTEKQRNLKEQNCIPIFLLKRRPLSYPEGADSSQNTLNANQCLLDRNQKLKSLVLHHLLTLRQV